MFFVINIPKFIFNTKSFSLGRMIMKQFTQILSTIVLSLYAFGCTNTSSSHTDRNHAPNIPSDPSPANGATNVSITPTLSWTATDPDDDVLTHGVFVSTNINFTTFVYDLGLTAPTDYFSSPLSYSTQYYWMVYAEDGQDTTWSPKWSFTTMANPVTTLYSESFESTVVPGTQWYAGDSNATNGLDYWGDQSSASGARVQAGSWSMYCADNSDVVGQVYDNYMNAYAQKVNPILISGYTQVTLSFWIWYNTETTWDYVSFQYWNGSSWVEAVPSGRSTGSSGGWVQKSFSFTGTNLYIRFVFYSDGSVTNEGVYIDDILVTGSNPSGQSDGGALEKIPVNVIDDMRVTPPLPLNQRIRPKGQ